MRYCIIHRALPLLSVVIACHRETSTTSTGPTDSPAASGAMSVGLAEQPPSSARDLQARGAFRVENDEETPPGLAEPWITVNMQTRAGDGSWWTLPAGGQLRSGEVFVVEIDLYRPAHVYVVNVSASGRSTLLYPDAEHEQDTRLERGSHRLPPARSDEPYIKMDAEVGTEHFFIIATPAPVQDVDDALGELIAKLRRAESPDVVSRVNRSPRRRASGRPPTRETRDDALFEANTAAIPALRSRGGYRARTAGAAIDARAGDDGVVVIPLRLEHI